MTETARRRDCQASNTGNEAPDATTHRSAAAPPRTDLGFLAALLGQCGPRVATWAFLQGAAVAYYVGLAQAIATIVIGYGLSVLAVALAPCMPSVKYGIEQFVGLRSTFGEIGARVVMVAVSTRARRGLVGRAGHHVRARHRHRRQQSSASNCPRPVRRQACWRWSPSRSRRSSWSADLSRSKPSAAYSRPC